jgi:hypothetical protein
MESTSSGRGCIKRYTGPDNGDEKERLKIWDAMLNSMKPMYERQ